MKAILTNVGHVAKDCLLWADGGLIVLKIVDIVAKKLAKTGDRYESCGWFKLEI